MFVLSSHPFILEGCGNSSRGRPSSVDTLLSAEGGGRAAFRLSYRHQKGRDFIVCTSSTGAAEDARKGKGVWLQMLNSAAVL